LQLGSILSQIWEVNQVISAIKNGEDEKTERDYFLEAISRIKQFDEVDFWTVKMDVKYPSCRIFATDNELSFILEIPKTPNYLDLNLLGVLVHEIAHIHDTVSMMTRSIDETKRKIGESFADVLAYSIVEYMFTHGVIYLIKNVIKISNASKGRSSHPSWHARIVVLKTVSDELWDNSKIIRRNVEPMEKLISLMPSLSPTEEMLVNRAIYESRNFMNEWRKFKADENLLSQLEKLNDDEIRKFGIIPEKIRELVIKCTS